jgi:hypothetical protein
VQKITSHEQNKPRMQKNLSLVHAMPASPQPGDEALRTTPTPEILTYGKAIDFLPDDS